MIASRRSSCCFWVVLVCMVLSLAAFSKPTELKHEKKVIPKGKWIDEFGQNNSESWAGKVSNRQNLIEQDSAEISELVKLHSLPDRDEYQAWNSGPTKRATGFFRLQKCGSRWWIIAPNGHLFYSVGIDCVGVSSFTPLSKKNKSAYAWLQPAEGQFAASLKNDSVSFYLLNLIRKWGADWRNKASKRAIDRCRSWGFTCLGNWSDDQLQNKQYPYVSMGPATWELKVPYLSADIADVYDPKFESETIRVAAKLEEHKTDKLLIGYFVDNELPWWNIPEAVLALDQTHACKQAWLGKLRKKYVSISALNKSWNSKAIDFESLRWPGANANKNADTDMKEFRAEFAERFYDCWYRAIKKADPNHLVLGSRIPYAMDDVVLACAKNTDVLSFNHYSLDLSEDFERYYKLTAKPILIGEYDFDSLDAGLMSAFVPVANQTERGKGYSFYTENTAAKPFMIGSHYFQYIDEPLTGRGDGENSFNGFVSVTDRPYAALVKSARKTNAAIYEIHDGKKSPAIARPRSTGA